MKSYRNNNNNKDININSNSMKRWIFIFLLALACTVSMIGCEKNEEKDKIEDKKENNLGSNILAVIDGEEITKDEALFYTYCQQANYEAYYLLYYQQELQWSNEADESGETMEEKVKTFLEESDKKLLERSQANEELVKKIYTRNALYDKVYEKIAEQLDIKVSQEDAKQAKITAVELASNQDREKTKEQLEKDAAAILKMVKNGKTLKVAAEAYGYSVTTGNVGKGDMNQNELEQTCLAMKTGEYKILDYLEYVYVLHCDMDFDEEATKLAKEEMEKEQTEEGVAKRYEEWLKDMNVQWNQSGWEDIRFDSAIFTIEDMDKVQNQESKTQSPE